jgi:hypothetical protein
MSPGCRTLSLSGRSCPRPSDAVVFNGWTKMTKIKLQRSVAVVQGRDIKDELPRLLLSG